ncbi:MAG: sodium/proline symporter [Thermovirgaceae bacterium]|jgi:sodium/proline symporter|nr:sodium/proline symporter [Synergistales bacterium]HPE90665.1 sodium/proline symporter [Synergistales bacterium]HPQ78356.1 sodium/proline symporter [Synergistales bacterium]HRW86943.1 sodium/proline symporter [Thermovirgaceae bacterium]
MTYRFEFLLPFVLYLIVLVVIGFLAYKKTKTMEGFHLGNRQLSPWVAGISILFSGSSGWIFLGCAGLGYSMGPSAWFMLISFMITMLIAYTLIGKRLRNYSGLLGSITYPEFFVRRVRSNRNGIRLIASLAVFVFMTTYVASQYVAAVKALKPIFNMTDLQVVLLTAVVVTLYCLIGGFMAVCWTDFVQGMVILGGSIIMCVFLVVEAGGFGEVFSKLAAIDPKLLSAKWATWPLILMFWTAGLGGVGRPHDTIRFFALKDSHSARGTAMVGEISLLFNYWTGYMIGYIGRVFFPALKDPETIFPTLLIEMFNPWFAGIMIAALMALIMSTIDSQLLSAASTFTEDFYHTYVNKRASEQRLVWVSRVSVVAIGVFGAVMAMYMTETVNNLVLFATAGLSSTFGPALVLSLYWKRLTEEGIIASMLTGLVVSVYWFLSPLKAITGLHESAVGFFFAITVAVVVSLLTKPLPSELVESDFEIIRKDYSGEEMAKIDSLGESYGLN